MTDILEQRQPRERIGHFDPLLERWIPQKIAKMEEDNVQHPFPSNPIDIAVWKIIGKALENRLCDEWKIYEDENGNMDLIVHNSFLQNNPDFVEKYLQARTAARKKGIEILFLFQEIIPDISGPEFIVQPTVCIQVEDAKSTAGMLKLPEETVASYLQKLPFSKQSSVILSASKQMPDHDFVDFYKSQARECRVPEEEYLVALQVHENVHPIIDFITQRKFKIFNTWLNEGVVEYFAGNQSADAILLRRKGVASLDIDMILKANPHAIENYGEKLQSTIIMYWGGCLLIDAIGKTYNRNNPHIGVIQFLSKVYGDGTESEKDINTTVREILQADGKLEEVSQKLSEIFPANQ